MQGGKYTILKYVNMRNTQVFIEQNHCMKSIWFIMSVRTHNSSSQPKKAFLWSSGLLAQTVTQPNLTREEIDHIFLAMTALGGRGANEVLQTGLT